MNRRVIRNTTAYMIAGMAPFAVGFFMLPIYTRFMEPSDYGVLSVMTALSSFLASVVGLQMGSCFTRLYFDYKTEERPALFSSVIIATLVLNVAMLLPLHLVGHWLTQALFPGADFTYMPYVALVFVAVFFGSFSLAGAFMLRVQEKGKTMLRISLINTLLTAFFGIYFVVIRKMGAHGALAGTACATATNATYLLFANRRLLKWTFDRAMVRASLKYSLPVIPHTMGGVLFMFSDKYILTYFVPLAAIGLYGIADKISTILNVMINAFKDAYYPSFMKQAKEDKAAAVATCREVMVLWMVLICTAYLAIALFAREILMILTPPKYHGAALFIPILLGSYIFKSLYAFPAATLMFEKKTQYIPIGTFAAGLFNIVANILLIPLWGVMVAAWTTLASHAITFLVAYAFSRRVFPLSYDAPRMLLVLGVTLFVYLALAAFTPAHFWLGLFIKGAVLLVTALVFLKVAGLTPRGLWTQIKDLMGPGKKE